MTQLTATFTVTIKTKPDGDYYFDHDDLVRNVVPWIEGGLDDRDDIAEVTITEQPAAVSAAVAPPTDRAAVLTESERKMLAYALDQAQEHIWSRDGFTDEDQAAVDSLRRLTTDEPAAGARQDGAES